MKTWTLFGRALMKRCPNCGQKGIFSRWLVLAEKCPSCRLHYERQEGYWVGAVAVNTVATVILFFVVFVGMLVLLWPDVPWDAVLVVVIGVNAVFPVVFYPWSKTIWMAIDLAVHPATAEDTAT